MGIVDRLLCPSCAREHPPSERFCASCGMPLVLPGARGVVGEPTDERREHARKIKPQYSEGQLVQVAYAQNQPEAEFIQGLLLNEGIPCLLRNANAGYKYGAVGPCEILVPESGVEVAREALKAPPQDGETAAGDETPD